MKPLAMPLAALGMGAALLAMPLSELRLAHEAWLPTYMNSAA